LVIQLEKRTGLIPAIWQTRDTLPHLNILREKDSEADLAGSDSFPGDCCRIQAYLIVISLRILPDHENWVGHSDHIRGHIAFEIDRDRIEAGDHHIVRANLLSRRVINGDRAGIGVEVMDDYVAIESSFHLVLIFLRY